MIQVQIERRSPDRNMAEGIKRFLERLSGDGFFGVVQIQYVDGEIVLVRKEESFKPSAFLVVE